jgi:hypothetical protein
MMKQVSVLAAVAAFTMLSIADASAQRSRYQRDTQGGDCSQGTMSNSCTMRAAKATNCTVANFKRCTSGKATQAVSKKRGG